jgi:hypothetical protein
VPTGSASGRNSKHRNTGGAYGFFISAPQLHTGFRPAASEPISTNTSHRQFAFVQRHVSPGFICMTGLSLSRVII